MAKNSKVRHFRGNNSYKGSPYNFIQMKTFDELDLLIISASKSFSLSIIVFGIMAKNCKNRQIWRLKGNNSYKWSLYDFDSMETFVELLMLKEENHLYFSLSVIPFEILANNCSLTAMFYF